MDVAIVDGASYASRMFSPVRSTVPKSRRRRPTKAEREARRSPDENVDAAGRAPPASERGELVGVNQKAGSLLGRGPVHLVPQAYRQVLSPMLAQQEAAAAAVAASNGAGSRAVKAPSACAEVTRPTAPGQPLSDARPPRPPTMPATAPTASARGTGGAGTNVASTGARAAPIAAVSPMLAPCADVRAPVEPVAPVREVPPFFAHLAAYVAANPSSYFSVRQAGRF